MYRGLYRNGNVNDGKKTGIKSLLRALGVGAVLFGLVLLTGNGDIQTEANNPAETEALINPEVSRLKGADRYATAVDISRQLVTGDESASSVVLARGNDFPDALAGVPLAHRLEAPLLLSGTERLPQPTVEEIKRVGAEKAYLLGGEAALSIDIERQLADMGVKVERIGGQDRYHTAQLVAEKVAPDGSNTAILASGRDFQDALIASPYAAVNGIPVLLSAPEELPGYTAEALEELQVRETIIVGDVEKISSTLMEDLPHPERVSNPEHYSNSVEVARYFDTEPDRAYMATGNVFADAIAGGVLAAQNENGIFLTGDRIPEEIKEYFMEKETGEIVMFGGEKAISGEVEDSVASLELEEKETEKVDVEDAYINWKNQEIMESRFDFEEAGVEETDYPTEEEVEYYIEVLHDRNKNLLDGKFVEKDDSIKEVFGELIFYEFTIENGNISMEIASETRTEEEILDDTPTQIAENLELIKYLFKVTFGLYNPLVLEEAVFGADEVEFAKTDNGKRYEVIVDQERAIERMAEAVMDLEEQLMEQEEDKEFQEALLGEPADTVKDKDKEETVELFEEQGMQFEAEAVVDAEKNILDKLYIVLDTSDFEEDQVESMNFEIDYLNK